MNYLVLLSGGLDSIASVFKLIEEDISSRFDLLHIQIRRTDYKWIPELYSVIKLYKYMKELGLDAHLHTPILSHLNPQAQDLLLYRTIGVMFSNERTKYDNIINGATKTDDILKKCVTPEYGESFSDNIPPRWQFGGKLSKLLIESYDWYSVCEMRRPLINMEKFNCYNLIPSYLPTWSCSHPVVKDNIFNPCNKCNACKECIDAGIKHKTIDTSDCAITKNAVLSHSINELNMKLIHNIE